MEVALVASILASIAKAFTAPAPWSQAASSHIKEDAGCALPAVSVIGAAGGGAECRPTLQLLSRPAVATLRCKRGVAAPLWAVLVEPVEAEDLHPRA